MDHPLFDPAHGSDRSAELLARVQQAIAERTPLFIRGGASKTFYGRAVDAQPLNVGVHTGIVSYDPTELVITARAGTPLAELQAALDEAERDPSVRVVLLTGGEACFTSGNDVADFIQAPPTGGDQPDRAGRGSMVSNLLLLVLWSEWCGARWAGFNRGKQVLGDYRTAKDRSFRQLLHLACVHL